MDITTKTELFAELKDSNQCVTKWFTEIPSKAAEEKKTELLERW